MRAIVSSAAALLAAGCALGEMAGAAFAYRHVTLDEARIHRDLAYRSDAEADPNKHRLDLFVPEPGAKPAPTLLFVHGGGWTSGDRAMGGLGVRPIQNIGRFYARRGFLTAVASYRLQPGAGWRDQVADVADAARWLARNASRYGGDPGTLTLAGHSAGAWLAAWVGLAQEPLRERDVDRASVCALALVSGAAYDLEDEQTFALGSRRSYFEELLGDESPDWAREASIAGHVTSPLPPTLVLTAGGEPARFQRQSDVLSGVLEREGGRVLRTTVPGQNHQRIVVSLSLADDPASDAVLDFLAGAGCAP